MFFRIVTNLKKIFQYTYWKKSTYVGLHSSNPICWRVNCIWIQIQFLPKPTFKKYTSYVLCFSAGPCKNMYLFTVIPKSCLLEISENNSGLLLSGSPSLLMLASFVQLVNTKIKCTCPQYQARKGVIIIVFSHPIHQFFHEIYNYSPMFPLHFTPPFALPDPLKESVDLVDFSVTVFLSYFFISVYQMHVFPCLFHLV